MSMPQAIITLVSAIISGILATVITITINARNEKRKIKLGLVDDIFGFRYQLADSKFQNSYPEIDIYSHGFKRAMNRVPIVFSECPSVLQCYDALFEALQISNNDEKALKSDEALINFLKALCKEVGIDCANWNDSKIKRIFN